MKPKESVEGKNENIWLWREKPENSFRVREKTIFKNLGVVLYIYRQQ
jgi:hypothetical protein